MSELMFVLFPALAGVVGAALADLLPASGKAALALTPLPILGLLLTMKFC
jgi:hypothetical protein